MLNQDDAKKFKKWSWCPSPLLDEYDAINEINSHLTQMQSYALCKDIIAKASSLKEAFQMYIAREGGDAVQAQKDRDRITVNSFKSRSELNAFLRRHGYRWHRNAEEDVDFYNVPEWELIDQNYDTVTVKQALEEIVEG